MDEGGDGVEGKAEKEGQGGLLCWTRGARHGLQEDDGPEEDRDNGQVEALILGETGEVVDDDPHVGPVESDENADMVQLLPGGPRDVTGHRVEQRAGQHAGLQCHGMLHVTKL